MNFEHSLKNKMYNDQSSETNQNVIGTSTYKCVPWQPLKDVCLTLFILYFNTRFLRGLLYPRHCRFYIIRGLLSNGTLLPITYNLFFLKPLTCIIVLQKECFPLLVNSRPKQILNRLKHHHFDLLSEVTNTN